MYKVQMLILTLLLASCFDSNQDKVVMNEQGNSQNDTVWKVTQYFTGLTSSFYDYRIEWRKSDSIIEYSIDSKNNENFIPVVLKDMTVTSKAEIIHFEFAFNSYDNNFPKFSYNVSDIDFNRIETISIKKLGNVHSFAMFTRSSNKGQIDSVCQTVLKK